MSRVRCPVALLLVAALALSGCGGDGEAGGGYGGGAMTATEPGGGTGGSGGGVAVVSTAEVGDLGAILVEAEGRTLYDFHRDEGTTSSCYGACAEGWPPRSYRWRS